MAFDKGDIAVYVVGGLPVIVEIQNAPDGNGAILIKRRDQPQQIVHVNELQELSVLLNEEEPLTAQEFLEWSEILGGIDAQAKAVLKSLRKIQKEVQSGKRQPNSPLEVAELATLRALQESYRFHAFHLRKRK